MVRHFPGMHRNIQLLTVLSYGILTILVFGFLLYVHIPHRTAFSLPQSQYFYNYLSEEALDANQTCHFPSLDPFDPSIWPYVADAIPIQCKERQKTLTFIDDEGRLRINETALRESGYRWTALRCHYQEIIRPEGNDERVVYGEPTAINRDGLQLEVEFVRVWCANFFGITIYSNVHAHVIPQTLILNGTGFRRRRKPSVMVFVIDSMSRLNFIRQLPKTYFYLVHDMDAVVLRGLTKVGDNTYPNMVPLLTGRPVYSHPELTPYFMPLDYSYPDTFDGWPFLWKNFSRIGYVTLFDEDVPHLSLFNYLAGGFRDPPTHHYLRPFWMAVEESTLNRLSSNLCCGSIPKHALFLDYIRQFLRKYRDVPYFALSLLTEISHDFLNQVGAADQDLVEFLRQSHESGELNDTFLVVMGDHGHRMSDIVETQIGSIERRMPFIAISVPIWFQQEFPTALQHLKENAKRLTSMYDLHHTFLDVLGYAEGNATFGSNTHDKGGTTLFGPISMLRECPDAGIPYQFCACDEEMRIELELVPNVQQVATSLVDKINGELKPYSAYCSSLRLKDIRSAVFMFPYNRWNQSVTILNAWKAGLDVKLRLTVEVSPSNALFEGLVVINKDKPTVVMDGINRLNRYGKQASCVPNNILQGHSSLPLYCYCTV